MPIVSSIRLDEEESALVRPSNARVLARLRIGRIDDDRGEPAGIQRRGQRQADQAAAQDDHVRSVSSPPP